MSFSVPIPQRVCVQCGKALIGNQRRFCSGACSSLFYYHEKNHPQKRLCVTCGAELNSRQRKYCTPCATVAETERRRLEGKRHVLRQKGDWRNLPDKVCQDCGGAIHTSDAKSAAGFAMMRYCPACREAKDHTAQILRFCQVCGVPLGICGPQKKYCEDCRKKKNAENWHKAKVLAREKKWAEKPRLCERCGGPLELHKLRFCAACWTPHKRELNQKRDRKRFNRNSEPVGNCAYCGKPLFDRRRKCCSPECYNRWSAAQAREKTRQSRLAIGTKICAHCGAVIPVETEQFKNRKYCVECSRFRDAHGGRFTTLPDSQHCLLCGREFATAHRGQERYCSTRCRLEFWNLTAFARRSSGIQAKAASILAELPAATPERRTELSAEWLRVLAEYRQYKKDRRPTEEEKEAMARRAAARKEARAEHAALWKEACAMARQVGRDNKAAAKERERQTAREKREQKKALKLEQKKRVEAQRKKRAAMEAWAAAKPTTEEERNLSRAVAFNPTPAKIDATERFLARKAEREQKRVAQGAAMLKALYEKRQKEKREAAEREARLRDEMERRRMEQERRELSGDWEYDDYNEGLGW